MHGQEVFSFQFVKYYLSGNPVITVTELRPEQPRFDFRQAQGVIFSLRNRVHIGSGALLAYPMGTVVSFPKGKKAAA
jgi:hypothetical protein